MHTHLTMKKQAINLVKTASFELWCINSIHHYLFVEAMQKHVLAFVMFGLDYCNSLLYGCPQYLINRLQKVRLILMVPKSKTDHITPRLQTLYWLPVSARIQYTICSLCFSAINSSCTEYLADLLKIYTPSRQLHTSADSCTTCVPSVHTKSYGWHAFSHSAPTLWNIIIIITCALFISSIHTKFYGQHAFSHSAPTLWNNLSKAVRNSVSFLSFKSALKTYLFQLYIWLTSMCVGVCVCVCVCVCVWFV